MKPDPTVLRDGPHILCWMGEPIRQGRKFDIWGAERQILHALSIPSCQSYWPLKKTPYAVHGMALFEGEGGIAFRTPVQTTLRWYTLSPAEQLLWEVEGLSLTLVPNVENLLKTAL